MELQRSLKNHDLQKTNTSQALSGLSPLPTPSCALGGQQHYDEASRYPHMDTEALKKLSKNKKPVKMLTKKYDAFLVSESLIKVPQILGLGLSKAGKFPSLLTQNENMVAEVSEVKYTIKFQMKKGLCLAVAEGHMKMTHHELVYNIHLAVSSVVSLLKNNGKNFQALYIKSTMGKLQGLY